MTLCINTKNQKTIEVALKKGKKVVAKLSDQNQFGSQILLPLILKVVKGTKGIKGIKGIEVETGPGSFTGIRVGVSVANAFGFSLGIPVNGKKMETDLLY